MVEVVGADDGGAVGVPWRTGSGLVRRGWAWVPARVPCLDGGRARGPRELSWSSLPGGCRGRVIPPVPAGVPAMRLSAACLEASDVSALVRRVHQCGGGFAGSGQVGVPKGRPALRGPQLCRFGGVSQVEECAEGVGCSFLPAEGGVEPAASDSEVVCYLLWSRLRPRFWRRGCCSGGRELWILEVAVTVVEVEGKKDVAGRHVQAGPAVA